MAAKITCRTRAKDLLEEIDFPRVVLEARPVGGDRIVLGLLRLPRFNREDVFSWNRNFKADIQQLLPFFGLTFHIWWTLCDGGIVTTWFRTRITIILLLNFILNTILIELRQLRILFAEEQRRLARYVGWTEEAAMAVMTSWMIWWIRCLPYDDPPMGGSLPVPT